MTTLQVNAYAPWKRKPGYLSPPEGFQQQLVDLAGRTRMVDLRNFEECAPQRIRDVLVPEVDALLVEAVDLLAAILDHYDEAVEIEDPLDPYEGAIAPSESRAAEADLSSSFYRLTDQMMARPACRRLCDVAFLARGEMRLKLDFLRGMGPDGEIEQVVSVCGSGLRRISKATTAVENALADCEGFERNLSYQTELRASLEVRSAYAKFRSALLATEGPSAATVRPSLQAAGAAIARLLGRDVYRDMRFADRAELRRLQQRLLAWLNDEAADPESGLRLWQDLVGFAELIELVNQRSELIEHDVEVAELVWSELFGSGRAPDRVPASLREPLRSLHGRSGALDPLIVHEGWTEIAAWRRGLRRLLDALGLARTSETDLRNTRGEA